MFVALVPPREAIEDLDAFLEPRRESGAFRWALPEQFHVELLRDAAEDGVVYGSKGVGEPPLMLAFSVREALRQAAAAFGPPGTSVDLPSPATPEAVYWALERARSAPAQDHLVEGGTGVVVEGRPCGAGVLRHGPTLPIRPWDDGGGRTRWVRPPRGWCRWISRRW